MCKCVSGTKRNSVSLTPPEQQSKKRRRVQFVTEQPSSRTSSISCNKREAHLLAPAAPLQQHPFCPTDQWLQPAEQKMQRLEALQDANRLSEGGSADHFRESYQGIYQICHALANESEQRHQSKCSNAAEGAVEDDHHVLPKQVGLVCTQLLSSHDARGLEDCLVPAVALARRLERKRTIRAVLACHNKHDERITAHVAQKLSVAHGKFAHALALGDAATAMVIYSSASSSDSDVATASC